MISITLLTVWSVSQFLPVPCHICLLPVAHLKHFAQLWSHDIMVNKSGELPSHVCCRRLSIVLHNGLDEEMSHLTGQQLEHHDAVVWAVWREDVQDATVSALFWPCPSYNWIYRVLRVRWNLCSSRIRWACSMHRYRIEPSDSRLSYPSRRDSVFLSDGVPGRESSHRSPSPQPERRKKKTTWFSRARGEDHNTYDVSA